LHFHGSIHLRSDDDAKMVRVQGGSAGGQNEESASGPPYSRLAGNQVREAREPDGALFALRVWHRRRDSAGGDELVQACDGPLGVGAEGGVEGDVASSLGGNVEDGAGGHGDAEHLLQAQGLGAELNVVAFPASSPATLVLDREGDVGAADRVGAELDEVGDADESKPVATEPEAACEAERAVESFGLGVDGLVGVGAFDGVGGVGPEALGAVQGAAARAEDQVVERPNRQQIVVGHGRPGYGHDITPPSGTA
jgi:hypothetical protein